MTAVGYAGLANTYVTVNQLITASGGLLTHVQRHDGLADRGPVAGHLERRRGQPGGPAQLRLLADARAVQRQHRAEHPRLQSAPTRPQLCQLVSINGSTCANGTLSTPALSASLDVLQMLTTEAELANGTSALDVSSPQHPRRHRRQLYLTLDPAPQVAYGPVGTTAQTAQLQADLKLSVSRRGRCSTSRCRRPRARPPLKTINCADNSLSVDDQSQPRPRRRRAPSRLAGSNIATLTITATAAAQIGYTTARRPAHGHHGAERHRTPITRRDDHPDAQLQRAQPAKSRWSTPCSPRRCPTVLGPVLQAAGVTVGGAEVADLSTTCGAVSLVQ